MTDPIAAPVDDGVDDLLNSIRELLDSDPSAALSHAEMLLPSTPDARIFRLAAEACRRLGLTEDAEDAELAAIQAGFRNPELNEAAVAKEEGRIEESRAKVDRFLEAHPDDLLARTMAAEADMQAWELKRAEAALRTILARAPSFLRAIMVLAKNLVLQARLGEAIQVVSEVIRRKPGNKTALQYLAELHAEANEHEQAAAVYGKVLALDPGDLATWIIYAQQLRMLGRKEESVAAFRRALALDPNSGAAWWGLVYYFASEIGDEDVATLEQALVARGGTAEDGGPLHISLGILAERRSDHEAAFNHIAEGKRLRAIAHPYDSADARAKINKLIHALSADLFARHGSAGFADASPIFIIGMPRSGTTLLERILGCHSQIEPGGELPIMPRLHEQVRRGSDSGYAERIAGISGDELTELGRWYVERSADYRPLNRPRFIDKLNTNWVHVGLIRLILPNARIIDLRRNALDCCWSNFKMLFAEGHIASNDQRDIARFYQDYVRMVEAVSAASPGGILHVRYEDIVDDAENQVRKIFDFLGLDFEPECMEFHRSTAAVATPSSEQVRRPINRDSIGAAEPYRQWLGPMIDELGPLAER
ncbi:MAG TPA: sulfotransferase [Sphingomicrobium sp.]|nr:sulfotransferase [Sphingomicrobium sp.]